MSAHSLLSVQEWKFNQGDNRQMEQRVRKEILKNIKWIKAATENALDSLKADNMNGVISALLDEDKRIQNTIALCKAVRDFSETKPKPKTYPVVRDDKEIRVTIPKD